MMIFSVVAQVEEQIRTLQECYKNKPEEEEENEGAGASMKEMLDAKWQSLLQRFFTMQDLGNNFINSSNMVRNAVEHFNTSLTISGLYKYMAVSWGFKSNNKYIFCVYVFILQISGNLNLNVKAAGHVVEKYMESLTRKKSELADLWTSWQLHYSQIKSVKKQWKKCKDQLKKVTWDFTWKYIRMRQFVKCWPIHIIFNY